LVCSRFKVDGWFYKLAVSNLKICGFEDLKIWNPPLLLIKAKIGFRVVEIRNIFTILHHSQSLYRRKFNPYSFDLYEFKRNYMGTLLQFKHFYLKAFEDCKPEI